MARYSSITRSPTEVTLAPPPRCPLVAVLTAGSRSVSLICSTRSHALRWAIPKSRAAAVIEPLVRMASSNAILPGPRMAKKLIRRADLDHCHPSWFLVENRPTAQATTVAARESAAGRGHQQGAFASASAVTSYSWTPRHNHQFTRRLGGNNVIVHPASHDIRQARHDALPWLGETTGCWTSLGGSA
jgi:hypothetical protein